MAEAIFLLVGVVVGGLMTFATEWFVEGRREAREVERESRVERAARRLVADEVDTIGMNLRKLASYGKTPAISIDTAGSFLPLSEWERHKGTLAAAIDDDQLWITLAEFYFNAQSLRARLLFDAPHSDFEEAEIEELHQQADNADRIHGGLLQTRIAHEVRLESSATS